MHNLPQAWRRGKSLWYGA